MAGIKDISSVWNNIKEIDLKPIRDSAVRPVKITLAGAIGAGKHALAGQLRSDPARPDIHTQSPITLLTLEADSPPPQGDLIILMVDVTRTDFSFEQDMARRWSEAGRNLLVFINKIDLVNGYLPTDSGQGWMAAKVLFGCANNSAMLRKEFVSIVLELLPQQHLALGRQFPLFRLAIANHLINETCFSNAAYSFSTGLAEIVPVLDLPLNLTDLIVLTKSQAFLAYKLGLLVGFSTHWQDYVTEFGGVIGGGFVWRQAARSLVGLVPGWGIIPKVAIAYSGTYVVGHAILGWYLSGRHLTSQQMRDLSLQAFARGREYARKISEKLPKRKPRGKKQEDLFPLQSELGPGTDPESPPIEETVVYKYRESGAETRTNLEGTDLATLESASNEKPSRKKVKAIKLDRIREIRFGRRKQKKDLMLKPENICKQCGKPSAIDAFFCQYCGAPFENISAG